MSSAPTSPTKTRSMTPAATLTSSTISCTRWAAAENSSNPSAAAPKTLLPRHGAAVWVASSTSVAYIQNRIALSTHLRSRSQVGEILLNSGVSTIVLQAGVVIGSGSASFEMIRHLTNRLPVMTTPRWVNNRIQPIAVRDVLYYLLAAATVELPRSRVYDIGGPDVLRYGEMMHIYADVAGLARRRILVLPVLTPKLAGLWIGLVTPVPPRIGRALIESLSTDAVAGENDIDAIIPPPPGGVTTYRDAVALALRRIETGEVETTWANASPTGTPADPLPSDPSWAGDVIYTDDRSIDCEATIEQVWQVVEGVGGENGWYSFPLAWTIRGWLDRLTGGVGLARRAPPPPRPAHRRRPGLLASRTHSATAPFEVAC